ncbi:MAG: hypothetical protein GWP91_18640 [Rhodobacterales bacterium]|nr:hypothetical protein [Rhodobacterales bacterium]
MNERQTIDRGWFYVREPAVPPTKHVLDGQGNPLTRRLHGYPARIQVLDQSGVDLPVATWLRAAAAVGFALETLPGSSLARPVTVILGPEGTQTALTVSDGTEVLTVDGPWVGQQPSAHLLNQAVAELFGATPVPCSPSPPTWKASPPTRRVLFFESSMNSDKPHNDGELAQGVLHRVSSLTDSGSEVVLANVKMPIFGEERAVIGLDRLESSLQGDTIGLIYITLLEGYWRGVLQLIETLRALGCDARIAVGGVMPTLTPEHVAAHLPEVSFVCRGAGEYFLPQLCRILGNTPADAALSPAQRHAFSQLDGLLVVDPVGRALVAGNPAKQRVVESLDSAILDLKYLEARHIQGGIERSTSRGCVHISDDDFGSDPQHMGAYFIASNSDTSAQDFVDSVTELCRLKLRHPRHFLLRFPIVSHLVSYFPSATHRRKIRRGWRHTMAIRDEAQVPNHGEFDYLFVDYDIPGDDWVAVAVDANLLTDENRYTTSLVNLLDCWNTRLESLTDPADIANGQRMVRQLDDSPRRLVFEFLDAARQRSRPDFLGTPLSEALAIEASTDFLGEPGSWLPQFARFSLLRHPTLAVQMTGMSSHTIEQAIEFLLATHRDATTLACWVDGCSEDWLRVEAAVKYAKVQTKKRGKSIQVRVHCGPDDLDTDRLAWMDNNGVALHLQVDATAEISVTGLTGTVCVAPALAQQMANQVRRMFDAGFEQITLDFTSEATWTEAQQKAFAAGLFAIGTDLKQRWAAGKTAVLTNLSSALVPPALNAEISVQADGTLIGGNFALLHSRRRSEFIAGTLDDLTSYDRLWMACPSHEFIAERQFPADIILQNDATSRVMTSFAKWMRRKGRPSS